MDTMQKYVQNMPDDKFYVEKWGRVKGIRSVGVQQVGILYKVVGKVLTDKQRLEVSESLNLVGHLEKEYSRWKEEHGQALWVWTL